MKSSSKFAIVFFILVVVVLFSIAFYENSRPYVVTLDSELTINENGSILITAWVGPLQRQRFFYFSHFSEADAYIKELREKGVVIQIKGETNENNY